MTCYYPIKGWYSKHVNEKTGKRSVVFNIKDALPSSSVSLPCGKCIGCRLERSKQWAVRCVHESMFHDQNCFITLTYDDDHVPLDRSLRKKDFQKFMKRLRKKVYPTKISYYMCGEYGDKKERPHYHACIFGYRFPDCELWSVRRGVKLYRSNMLESLWNKGYSTMGDVTFESAAYCARYILKKQYGNNALKYINVIPEYNNMSLKPAIGKRFYEKFKDDMYRFDAVIMRGKKCCKPVKYYDKLFDISNADELKLIKERRVEKARLHKDYKADNKRLDVLEESTYLKTKVLVRSLDYD